MTDEEIDALLAQIQEYCDCSREELVKLLAQPEPAEPFELFKSKREYLIFGDGKPNEKGEILIVKQVD
jgi:hypothetical protein